MKAPIYMARRLIGHAARDIQHLAARYGLEIEPDPHVTLAYSRAMVDWTSPVFDVRDDQVHVSTADAHFEKFGQCIVLVFQSPEIHGRHQEFQAAGASCDFETYNAHITIGYDRERRLKTLPDLCEVPKHLVFGAEYKEELILDPQEDPLPAP